MRVIRCGVAAMLAAASLSGCATLRGSQESVLGTSVDDVKADKYKRDKIIADFAAAPDEAARVLYRAQVAAVFLEAIAEKYDLYTQALFNEGTQLNLGLETAIIGLGTTATLVDNSADELAPIMGAIAGLDAAIDKNLYFDRTLPALIATMDARRARVEADILANLQRPTAQYPIQMLLRDLRRLQNAGTLSRSILDVTADASVGKAEAEAELQRQYELARAFSCVPEEDQDEQLDPIITALRIAYRNATSATATADVRTRAELQVRRIAAVAEVNPIGGLETVRNRILDKLDTEVCTTEDLRKLNDRFAALGGGS